MGMSPHLARWLFASVAKHFEVLNLAVVEADRLKFYVEGQNRDTRTSTNIMEVRMDGPYYTQTTRGRWTVRVEVNILVQAVNTNFHAIHKNVGLVSSMFTDISVNKYGSGASDDDSFIECLRLQQDSYKRERLIVSHFGLVEPDLPLVQSTVEGHYEMDYCE